MFFVLSQLCDREKKSEFPGGNPDSALRCFTTEPQRLNGCQKGKNLSATFCTILQVSFTLIPVMENLQLAT